MFQLYFTFFCISSLVVVAEVRLASFLASQMVLQREQPRLWGWADPGVNITVTLRNTGVTVFAIADSTGSWTVDLPPQMASAGHVIEIISDDDLTTIRLEDVAFGDMYLCSGQSNMEMSVGAGKRWRRFPRPMLLLTLPVVVHDLPIQKTAIIMRTSSKRIN